MGNIANQLLAEFLARKKMQREIKKAAELEKKAEQKPEKKVKELKKPDPEEKEYLDMAARHLIMSYYSWMKGDFTNRVLNVNKSPEELKRKLGNDRTRWFAMDKGTAHINMFDDYVQLLSLIHILQTACHLYHKTPGEVGVRRA